MDQRLYAREQSAAALLEELTPRQREVLACLAMGMSNAEIADKLGISIRTVEGHFAGAFECLGVSTRAAAMSLLVRLGLLEELPAVGTNR